MARVVFITLALMGIIPLRIHLVHGDVHEHVQLHTEQLSPDMAEPLHSVEQGSQGQSWAAKGALLLAALLHWQLWVFPGVLFLLFGFLWCIRKTKYLPDSSSKIWVCVSTLAIFLRPFFFPMKVKQMQACGSSNQKSSKNKEEDNDEEDDSDSDETCELGRIWADRTQWPAPYMADKCQLVEELVDDLLRACRGQTCHSFTPRLQPAIGVACVYEGWSARQDSIVYRLLVPMRPPPGHNFHVELGEVEETSTRKSCLRVELECTCVRERVLGDMLCFLHHAPEELREKQPSLLDTFCTGSYLHVGKSTCWFQNQVKAAWRRLPQSRDCRLELLPSHHSCKIKLTTPSKNTFTIEMTLGVRLDESDTFLSIA